MTAIPPIERPLDLDPTSNARVLADWAAILLKYAKTPFYDISHPLLTAQDIRQRLAALFGDRDTVIGFNYTLCVIAQIPAIGPRLFDLPHILEQLVAESGLATKDPSFPWLLLRSNVAPKALADYDLPWTFREQARFHDGTYQIVPWPEKFEPIPGHFVHISVGDPSLVAFTDTPEKGLRDIQTPIKPGRYLARFYPELDPHEVRDFTDGVYRAVTLRYARAGSVCLNKFQGSVKWISALIILPPGLAAAH